MSAPGVWALGSACTGGIAMRSRLPAHAAPEGSSDAHANILGRYLAGLITDNPGLSALSQKYA